VQSITASITKQQPEQPETKIPAKVENKDAETTSNSSKKIVKSAKSYINQHLSDRNLTLRQVADDLHINYYYLSKCFKESEEISFTEYVTNKRLQIASNLLTSTSLHVYEVCEQIGMETKNFHNLFRKKYNMTPQEYRKN
jgi:YesN/AraC family two-component response regulator